MPCLARCALAVTALLVLTACNGEGAETAETEQAAQDSQVQSEEFAAQADEACQGTATELQLLREELFMRGDGATGATGDVELTPADAQQSLERAAALVQTELAQLEELEPPAEQQAEIEAWLDEVRAAAMAYGEGAESEDAAAALVAGEDPLRAAETTADALGLGLCGTELLPTDEVGDPQLVPTEDETLDAGADA